MNDKDTLDATPASGNMDAPSLGNGGQEKENSGWPDNSGNSQSCLGEGSGQGRPEDKGEGGLPGGSAPDVLAESSADASGQIEGEGSQACGPSFDMRVFASEPNEFLHEQTMAEDEACLPLAMHPVVNVGFGAKDGAANALDGDAGVNADDGRLPEGSGLNPASGKSADGKNKNDARADIPKRPRLDSPDLGPATVSSKIFSFFSLIPVLWLVAILAGLTIWGLGQRELWFSDEVRHGNAFQNLLHHGKWLVLEMNGQAYPDKPPLYFWFLRALFELVKVEGPFLYLLAAAVSGLLYLVSFLALGKFVARFDRRSLFASGLVLLLCGYVYGAMHYARMDLLFSALIVSSQVMLYLALIRKRSLAFMGLAFLLAGLAVLVKGPLGIVLPLVTGLAFIIWCGNFKRLFRLDVLLGIIIFVIIIGLWAVAIIRQTGGSDYLFNEILGKQVAARAVDAFHHKQPWHYYFSRLPLAFLPFSFILFCLPWNRFGGKSMRQAIAASRKPEKDGLGFVWIMFITGFVILSLTSTKILIYFMPVFPALALIAGRAILSLTGSRASAFRYLVALFLFIGAVGLVIAAFMLNGLLPLPEVKGVPDWPPLELAGALLVAAIILLCACWLAFALGGSRPEGVLLSLTVAWLLFSWPLGKMVAPAFDGVLSPKGQALVLKEYADAGYAPVSYREYAGTYAYYAKHNTRALKSLDDANALAAEGKKYILALRAKDWDEWKDKPDCLGLVDRRWISEREYALAVCPSPQEGEDVSDAHLGDGHDQTTGRQQSGSDAHTVPQVYGQPDSDSVQTQAEPDKTPESVSSDAARAAPEAAFPNVTRQTDSHAKATSEESGQAPSEGASQQKTPASDSNEASAAPPVLPLFPERNHVAPARPEAPVSLPDNQQQ